MRYEPLHIDRHEIVFWLIAAVLAVLMVLVISPRVIAIL
jgi:hypothetical protein